MNTRRMWLAVAAVWTALGLLASSRHIAFRVYSGRDFDTLAIVGRTMLDWWTCGIFTPAIFAVARRFRLDDGDWLRNLPIHIVACALYIVLKLAIFLPLVDALGWLGEPLDFVAWLYGDAFPLTIAYASVVAAYYGVSYYEGYRRTAELEARLSRVQLDALRAQLHPHFLFNALNALSTLIHKDPQAADRMVLELSELLRHTLTVNAPAEVPLREEIAFVERYLGIMQQRFGDRLRVTIDVPAAVEHAMVPNLVLQPLIENALVHGVGRSAAAGAVTLRARRAGDTLELVVLDDGPGLDNGAPAERIGLRNTRLLLEQLYGKQQQVELATRPEGGGVARVVLPFHDQPWLRA
jgi:two-component system, LytTR family, sensor kinase